MKRELYFNQGFCCVVEDGRLVEYILEDESDQAGGLVIGRVDRMMASLRCAFVDIGRKRSGFLPLAEDSRTFQGQELHSGDMILAQIKKEEMGEKGAFLTRDITLPGKYLILMPMNRHVGVSSRIQKEEDRERLLEIGKALAEDRMGIVMRAAAEQASQDALQEELSQLWQQWEGVCLEVRDRQQPGLLSVLQGHFAQLRNDYAARGIDHIYEGIPLLPALKNQLREAAQRRVNLPHGGTIVIDRCEAMTVIDVNSSGNTGSASRRETILQTNLEACEEIAIQIRLRNLSGMILIDFINMESETDRSLVSARLQTCLELDRVKTVIHGYTSLGLMEMTRKRTRPDYTEQWTIPCAACHGSGRVFQERMEA